MANIMLYNDQQASATFVPNLFIDEYMTQANGEYVKIYLYLLRSLNQSAQNVSLSAIADHFDCTERDILRALKYWEKLRLFRLEFDAEQNLSGIRVLNIPEVSAPAPQTAQMQPDEAYPLRTQRNETQSHTVVPSHEAHSDKTQSYTTAQPREAHPMQTPSSGENVTDQFIQAATSAQRTYTMDEMRAFGSREEVRELIFITEKYLGRTLNQNDLNSIFFWYDELKLSTDLIEFLIENCVAKGKTSLHYMQKIAQDYAVRNIRTVEEARQVMNQNSTVYHAVMKAFGISGRNLVPSETDFLTKWTSEWEFSVELIEEACNRTIRSIHKPSFVYANSILEKWQHDGVRTTADIARSDSAYQQSQKSSPTAPAASASSAPKSNNRFINFQQRDNDYKELQRKLLEKSILKKPTDS